ncbi:TRAP transporter small permease subunit [Paracoccus sp. CPCC 101403]|uniref:TRAP transporter small permease protein n=1 Tax=Paracoccus broussonetiae TaxID=3075834 RepID=A0ABU3EK24_9RHOB|nr:TRAP transporter small permease subunit [Paracoccus sp. CPCC 101403]MDT1064609.1 TRAP transporter small permease subunit [Paracoccus sp. CPCC 101403]
MEGTPLRRVRAAEAVADLSQGLVRVEKLAAGLLMGILLALILLNVSTRALRTPIYWIDEASILAMVWLGFIGASVMIRLRIDFAVTLLADNVSNAWNGRVRALASGLSLAFAIGLAVMCWFWLDPIGIASHGFDAKSYAGESFNFLYTEHTQTLEWPTWLVSIVIPIFSLTLIVHTAANLLEDLGLVEKRTQDAMATAEEAA